MSALAFSVWVFALGGFWSRFSWWAAGWGTVALVGFGLIGLFVKPRDTIVSAS